MRYILISLVVIGMLCMGCVTNGSSSSIVPPQTIETFGNGVLYFHGNQGDFGYALSNYIKDNPNLRVVSIASDDTVLYGATAGYFVIVENRTCEL